MTSAVFLAPSPSREPSKLEALLHLLAEIRSAEQEFLFSFKGPAEKNWGYVKIQGSPESVQRVVDAIGDEPLLRAEGICDWCFAREAVRELSAELGGRVIAALICEVCAREGAEEPLLRHKRNVLGP